jgi:hypothetical protein
MNTKGHIYLRINNSYTATIRTLHNLSQFINNQQVDSTFGEISEVSNVSKEFLNEVKKIVSSKKKKMRESFIGKPVYLFRNQAWRDSSVVAVSDEHLLVEYVMPNGTSALNLIKDINEPNNYKTITYKNASLKFDINLNSLINNPQK